MADIRINALATTAASTASDDFLAVDGSANGTRKLNAYSPTFGGNLTVSGTGTSSVAGNLGVGMTSPGSRLDVIASTPTLGGATAKGTLNVGTVDAGVADSGGSITFSGSQNVAGGNIRVLGAIAGLKTTTDLSSGYLAFYASASGSVTEYMRLFANGNLFVGASPVDGGQKLQVAGDIAMTNGSGNGTLTVTNSANKSAFVQTAGSTAYLGSAAAGMSCILTSDNGYTALTLDSSQNATFAGSIAINNTVQTAVAVASTHKVTISIGGSTYYLLATNV